VVVTVRWWWGTAGAIAAVPCLALAACGEEATTASERVSVDERDGGARNASSSRPYPGISSGGRVVGGDGEPDEPVFGSDAGPAGGADGIELDPSCGSVSEPVDVILIVNTSGRMQQEILAIQDNINNNFAQILDAQGVDYSLILLADYGVSDLERLRICI
jgi:hypothetical protein